MRSLRSNLRASIIVPSYPHNLKPSPAMSTSATPRYKLVFFVPLAALSACKTAVFAAGAGRHPDAGDYTEWCFTSVGTGQFRPGVAARPHIGTAGGALEEVPEARVETLCVGTEVVREAVEALKKCVFSPFGEVC